MINYLICLLSTATEAAQQAQTLDPLKTEDYLKILLTILGSGAFFSFIQFMLTRKDKKEENSIDKKLEEIKKCFTEGLDEREKTGKKRFDEHKIAIEEININHEKDLLELRKSLEEITKMIEKQNIENSNNTKSILENQKNANESIMGLAHDKIIYLTDKITERGAITIKEQSALNSIYEPYKRMGGNSYAKAGYDHSMELDVVSEEVAREMDKRIKVKSIYEMKEVRDMIDSVKNEMKEDIIDSINELDE